MCLCVCDFGFPSESIEYLPASSIDFFFRFFYFSYHLSHPGNQIQPVVDYRLLFHGQIIKSDKYFWFYSFQNHSAIGNWHWLLFAVGYWLLTVDRYRTHHSQFITMSDKSKAGKINGNVINTQNRFEWMITNEGYEYILRCKCRNTIMRCVPFMVYCFFHQG